MGVRDSCALDSWVTLSYDNIKYQLERSGQPETTTRQGKPLLCSCGSSYRFTNAIHQDCKNSTVKR